MPATAETMGINNHTEFIFRVLINRAILAKNKANAKTNHKITSEVGKVLIKKTIYGEKVRNISLLKGIYRQSRGEETLQDEVSEQHKVQCGYQKPELIR